MLTPNFITLSSGQNRDVFECMDSSGQNRDVFEFMDIYLHINMRASYLYVLTYMLCICQYGA